MLRSGASPHLPAKPYFSGHITWKGKKMLRHFSVNRLGEYEAYLAALSWRSKTAAKLLREAAAKGERVHKKFAMAGVRRS